MHTAEPAIGAVKLSGVDFTGEHSLAGGSKCDWLVREQGNPCVCQGVESQPHDRVAQERCRFLLLVGSENRVERPMPGGDDAQDLTLGSRESVGRRGKLFQVANERIVQIWQRRGVGPAECAKGDRI